MEFEQNGAFACDLRDMRAYDKRRVTQAVRMLTLRLELHQICDVDSLFRAITSCFVDGVD